SRGLSERHPWRPNRPCRHSHDHMVRHSWLAQRRAARSLPADWRRDFRNERAMARSKRRSVDGEGLVFRLRASGIAGRDMGRAKALWTFGRSRLSPDSASPFFGLGNFAGIRHFRSDVWVIAGWYE